MKIAIYILLFGSLVAQASKNTPEKLRNLKWKILQEKDQIIVYIPENYHHDSGIVPIKFEGILDHHISKVLTVLADDKRKKEWLPKAKVVKTLEKKSASDFIAYYRYDAPWPFHDRDFIIKNEGQFDQKTLRVSVNLYSVEHHDDPAKDKKDTIRGYSHGGYTIISPLSENKTKVEMTFMNDFGGLIPKWIINIVQKKWPFKFMENLRTQLDKPDITVNPEYTLEPVKK